MKSSFGLSGVPLWLTSALPLSEVLKMLRVSGSPSGSLSLAKTSISIALPALAIALSPTAIGGWFAIERGGTEREGVGVGDRGNVGLPGDGGDGNVGFGEGVGGGGSGGVGGNDGVGNVGVGGSGGVGGGEAEKVKLTLAVAVAP